jgi:hypothetical protein
MLSLSEAAKQTCQSKSTIWRAIKAGRISATRTDTGEFQIDPAELFRVYPIETAAERADPVSVKRDAMAETATETPTETVLRAEIDALRQVGELLRSQLDDVKADRDAWRGQAQAGTLLLTHSAPAKRRWLRRLVG